MERVPIQGPVEPLYNATMIQIESLIAVSAQCRQYLGWQCRSSVITHPISGAPITYWRNRYGEDRSYFGGTGVVTEPGTCACSVDKLVC